MSSSSSSSATADRKGIESPHVKAPEDKLQRLIGQLGQLIQDADQADAKLKQSVIEHNRLTREKTTKEAALKELKDNPVAEEAKEIAELDNKIEREIADYDAQLAIADETFVREFTSLTGEHAELTRRFTVMQEINMPGVQVDPDGHLKQQIADYDAKISEKKAELNSRATKLEKFSSERKKARDAEVKEIQARFAPIKAAAITAKETEIKDIDQAIAQNDAKMTAHTKTLADVHYDRLLAKKYGIRKLTIEEDKRSVDLYYYDEHSAAFPPLELQARIRAESLIAAAKIIFDKKKFNPDALNPAFETFMNGLKQLSPENYSGQKNPEKIWERERKTIEQLIKNLQNNMIFIWQNQFTNFESLSADRQHDIVKELTKGIAHELEHLTASDKFCPAYKQADILVVNQHPNVRSAQYYQRGIATGPTDNKNFLKFRSAHNRSNVGLANGMRITRAHLDEASKIVTSDTYYRHASFPLIDLFRGEPSEMVTAALAAKNVNFLVEEMRKDLGIEFKESHFIEAKDDKVDERSKLSPAQQVAAQQAKLDAAVLEGAQAKLHGIHVSLVTWQTKAQEARQIRETFLAADAIRSQNINLMMFCLGVDAFVRLPSYYPAAQRFENERALIQLMKLFVSVMKHKIPLGSKLMPALMDYENLLKNKFTFLFDAQSSFRQRFTDYQDAFNNYREAIDGNSIANEAKKIAETKKILESKQAEFNKCKEHFHQETHELFEAFLAGTQKYNDPKNVGFNAPETRAVANAHSYVKTQLTEFKQDKDKANKLNSDEGQMLLAFQDLDDILKLFQGDAWNTSEKNFVLQSTLMDLAGRLRKLGAPVAASIGCKSNNDRGKTAALVIDGITGVRYVKNFDTKAHAVGHASMYSTISDTDGGGSKFGKRAGDAGDPNPIFAGFAEQTESWASHKMEEDLLKMGPVKMYKTIVTTQFEDEFEQVEEQVLANSCTALFKQHVFESMLRSKLDEFKKIEEADFQIKKELEDKGKTDIQSNLIKNTFDKIALDKKTENPVTVYVKEFYTWNDASRQKKLSNLNSIDTKTLEDEKRLIGTAKIPGWREKLVLSCRNSIIAALPSQQDIKLSIDYVESRLMAVASEMLVKMQHRINQVNAEARGNFTLKWSYLDKFVALWQEKIAKYESKQDISPHVLAASMIVAMVANEKTSEEKQTSVIRQANEILFASIQPFISQITHLPIVHAVDEKKGEEKSSAAAGAAAAAVPAIPLPAIGSNKPAAFPISTLAGWQAAYHEQASRISKFFGTVTKSAEYKAVSDTYGHFLKTVGQPSLVEKFQAVEATLAAVETWIKVNSKEKTAAVMVQLKEYLLQQREMIAKDIVNLTLRTENFATLQGLMTLPNIHAPVSPAVAAAAGASGAVRAQPAESVYDKRLGARPNASSRAAPVANGNGAAAPAADAKSKPAAAPSSTASASRKPSEKPNHGGGAGPGDGGAAGLAPARARRPASHH